MVAPDPNIEAYAKCQLGLNADYGFIAAINQTTPPKRLDIPPPSDPNLLVIELQRCYAVKAKADADLKKANAYYPYP